MAIDPVCKMQVEWTAKGLTIGWLMDLIDSRIKEARAR